MRNKYPEIDALDLEAVRRSINLGELNLTAVTGKARKDLYERIAYLKGRERALVLEATAQGLAPCFICTHPDAPFLYRLNSHGGRALCAECKPELEAAAARNKHTLFIWSHPDYQEKKA